MWQEIIAAALPALIQAGSGYITQSGGAAAQDRRQGEQNMFNAQESALQRQHSMDMLMAQLAQSGAGQGAANAIRKKELEQRAYEAAINAMLSGGQNVHSGANTLFQGLTLPARV